MRYKTQEQLDQLKNDQERIIRKKQNEEIMATFIIDKELKHRFSIWVKTVCLLIAVIVLIGFTRTHYIDNHKITYLENELQDRIIEANIANLELNNFKENTKVDINKIKDEHNKEIIKLKEKIIFLETNIKNEIEISNFYKAELMLLKEKSFSKPSYYPKKVKIKKVKKRLHKHKFIKRLRR